MKKWMLLLFLLPLTGLAQSGMYKYFIFFSDKNNSPYSLTAPSSFLTQLAIDRRSRQQIPFDSLDLPVNPSYMNGVGSTGARLFARSKWFNGIIVECDSTVLAQILNLPYVSGGKKINRHGPTTHSKFET